jgi:hypothetical protein
VKRCPYCRIWLLLTTLGEHYSKSEWCLASNTDHALNKSWGDQWPVGTYNKPPPTNRKAADAAKSGCPCADCQGKRKGKR